MLQIALESACAWPARPSHPDGLCPAPYAAAPDEKSTLTARPLPPCPARRNQMSDESARLPLAISVPGVGIILAVISQVAAQASHISPQWVFSASTCLSMLPKPKFPIAAPAVLAAKLWAYESDHENFSPVTQLSLVQTRAGNTRRTMRSCHFLTSWPSVLNRGPDRTSSLASTASLRLCR